MKPFKPNDTEIALFNALCAIAKQKPYKEISVKELCQSTAISRATFYRVFPSKDSIVTWYFNYLVYIGVGRSGRDLSFQEAETISLEKMFLTKEVVLGIKTESSEAHLRTAVNTLVGAAILDTIRYVHHHSLTEELLFQVEAFSQALSSMTVLWIKNDLDLPPKKLALYLENTIPYTLRSILLTAYGEYCKEAE